MTTQGNKMGLAELTKKRQEHIQSCRENNDYSHDLISGLYSDPSHFIYELLQNADDAKASEVIFTLSAESLEFKHNGEILFDFKDVDSITAIGSSTKKDDVNSIGTFGAGFKSVFAVTKAPKINSGDYHFRIVDFIVPERIESLDSNEGYTIIYLPFNHHKLSKEDAYQIISNRLKSLESESLLFLRNIREIKWSTESDKGHYLCETNGDNASIISQVNDHDELKDYILFKKIIEIDGANLNISVAYPLNTDGSKKIVPALESKLFVFFPTKVETRLKFLVHAPYKTTPGRETIPFEDNQNRIITNELSALIAESIEKIKNKNLLDVDYLNILPIESENKHPLYSAAFQKVKYALTNNPLLPISDKGYANATDALLAGKKELTTLLDHTDCSDLFNRKFWLSTDITYYKTRTLRDYVIDVLGIPEITMQKFCREISLNFMKEKSDQWIIDFYTNVTKSKELYNRGTDPVPGLYNRGTDPGILRQKPIIRLEDGSHVNPDNDAGDVQVYLPSDRKSKFKTVKRTISESNEASEFLKSLELIEPDDIAEIKEFIIPKYQGSNIENDENDENKEDIEGVFAIWEKSDESKRKEISDLLKESKLIRCINQNQSIYLEKPDNVYFHSDKLNEWFQNNSDDGIYFLDTDADVSKKFLESLGVRYDLKLDGIKDIYIREYARHQRSVNGFNPDFYLPGLEFSLDNITIGRSIFLWSVLLRYPNKLKGYIEKRTNKAEPYEKGEEKISKAMDALNKCSWLYDKDNKVITSSLDKIGLDDLSDEYSKEGDNIEKLVKALGLKLDVIREFEEKTGMKAVPKKEYEEFQEFRKYKNRNEDEPKKEDKWSPEVKPEDVIINEGQLYVQKPNAMNLTGQNVDGGSGKINIDEPDEENEIQNDLTSKQLTNRKAIGDWGEAFAKLHLEKKYPPECVNWLNKNGNVGKGYDFVIKENGKEIAYYEVKSKIDDTPQLILISGTQWGWAQNLHNDGKGNMYNILLISNAGKKNARPNVIKDPVALWKKGGLYADPVKIKL